MQCALASLENDTKVNGETVHPVGPHRAELEARVEGDLLRREGVKVERLQATNVGDRLRYREAVGVLSQVGDSLPDTYPYQSSTIISYNSRTNVNLSRLFDRSLKPVPAPPAV